MTLHMPWHPPPSRPAKQTLASQAGKEGDAYGGQPNLGERTLAGSCFTEWPDCVGSPHANKRYPRSKSVFTICETRVILR